MGKGKESVKFSSAISFLLIGAVLGWAVRPYWDEWAGIANTGDVARTIVDAQQHIRGSSVTSVFEKNGLFPNAIGIDLSVTKKNILILIEQQKVKRLLTTLKQYSFDLVNHSNVFDAFRNNLYILAEQENWPMLQVWVDSMLGEGFEYSVLYLMDAKLKVKQGNLLGALDSLFTARYYSLLDNEVSGIQIGIENIVIDMMNAYQKKSGQVSRIKAFSVLQFVVEKQPENPLFGIEIARLHADEGEIQLAIDTLNYLPYSEQYQDVIVSYKTAWLNELNALIHPEQVTTAIPLVQVGNHFHVTVVLNQERTLDLMIDTGATTTALSKDVIEFLKEDGIIGEKAGTVSINTANGVTKADYYNVDTFAIGEYVVGEFEVLEVELSDSADFDGLLGMNFLSLFEFEIDQTNRQLFLTARRNQ